MRAGEAADHGDHARPRHAPAPTIRALAALVVLATALLVATGTVDGPAGGHRRVDRVVRGVEVLGDQVTRPVVRPSLSSSTTSSSSTTTTTTATPMPPAPSPAVLITAPASPPPLSTTCADALAYLAAHQAPGFSAVCADGTALGHLGFTCVNQPGMCEGQRIIRIACPAPYVYMNEAHNSWVLIGVRTGIDPYGQGNAAERAACDPHR
jgi:hypothetical protein